MKNKHNEILFEQYLFVFHLFVHISFYKMMMIAFITFNSSLVPLIEGLCCSNPLEFEFTGFGWNRSDDLGINSPSL